MIEYSIRPHGSTPEAGVIVTVSLYPQHHHSGGGSGGCKRLALALMPMLDFKAHVQNGVHGVAQVDLAFFDPVDDSPNIGCRFLLRFADDEEIERIAKQAQNYLERRLTKAVDVFSLVLAVGTVDPYQYQLRIQHGGLAADAARRD